jgi:hypothetical protein
MGFELLRRTRREANWRNIKAGGPLERIEPLD